jgi:hypothetical protein
MPTISRGSSSENSYSIAGLPVYGGRSLILLAMVFSFFLSLILGTMNQSAKEM